MNEEIVVNFGGNLGPLGTALRGAKGMVKDFGQEITKHLASIATAWIGVEGVMRIGGWARETIQWAKELRSLSEETGASTGFLQGFQHVAMTLGLDSGKAGDAMNYLARKIGEAREGSKTAQEVFRKWGININGKTNEQVFYEISDALSRISDPAERAALRFEILGKAGKEMAAALDHGSTSLKEIMSEARKLSDAQIQQLANLGNAWKDFFEQVETGWKRILSQFGATSAPQMGITEDMVRDKAGKMFKPQSFGPIAALIAKMTGDKKQYFPPEQMTAALQSLIDDKNKEAGTTSPTKHDSKEHERRSDARRNRAKEILKDIKEAEELRHQNALKAMTPEQRLLELTREKLALDRKIHATGRAIADKAKDRIELEKTLTAISQTQKEIEDKKKNAADRQNEILKARDEIAKLGRERERAQNAEYMPTLEQLVNSGYSVFRHNENEWQQGPFAQQARELLNLQGDAVQAKIWGNADRFKSDTSRIDELRSGLIAAGVMSPDDRMKSIDDKIGESRDHLHDLLEKANSDGITVKGIDE